jgi:hypothetical protein
MQGGGINDSEAWTLTRPLEANEGRAKLLALQARLPFRERMMRLKAIADANAFIDKCEVAGGVSAQVSKSFMVSGDRNRRVDIEVISGVAFVPPPPPPTPTGQQGSLSC